MNEDKIYSTALSILASPSSYSLGEKIHIAKPREIFENIPPGQKPSVVSYISRVYGNDVVPAAEKILRSCERIGVKVIDFWGEGYPALLKQISHPPLVLYCIGNMKHDRTVSVVGTRKSDVRADRVARTICGELAGHGISTVSGIAIGIDREAHFGSLEAGGATVAVLANGIDMKYPKANRDLYDLMERSESSLIISEYPPGIVADKWTFVRRNRIISGMSPATVVIKAGERSGALITARYALDQNRTVFACCGYSFDEGYAGSFQLLKQGAVPVYNTFDILNELGIETGDGSALKDPAKTMEANRNDRPPIYNFDFDENSLEKKIVSLLYNSSVDADSIVRHTGSKTSEVNEALMILEIAGVIGRRGNLISLSGQR